MRPAGLVIHYAEVATKGKNRPKFLQRLAWNIDHALAGLAFERTRRISGRLWVRATGTVDLGVVTERMGTVYGISSYSPAVRAAVELDDMKSKALALVEGRTYQTFRVSARRVFKDQPLGSQEVDREVGAFLVEKRPAKVKLEDPELQVYIEMLPEGAYLYVDKIPGARGLPVGITGKVACLMSGGIDSPVAAARMQRRGCRVMLIHFHSHPFVSRASQEKALELAAHLARYQGMVDLFLAPFGELQRTVVTSAPAPLRVILYRRFMVRIAARLAAQHRARALVTGEALGQVASQTLANLVAVEAASPLPILRPLIGFDKQEIIDAAVRLGTYETSIRPDEDCCTLFVPRDPETHAKLPMVEAAESALDIEALCQEVLARTEARELRAPWVAPTAALEPEGFPASAARDSATGAAADEVET
jgi:thiamine biosynthesis protein ThiI